LRGKSIGPGISDFGFRIFWFSFSIRIPQSAFRNLEAGRWAIHRIAPTRIQPEDVVMAMCPPGPGNGMLMVFPRNPAKGGTSWPGNP